MDLRAGDVHVLQSAVMVKVKTLGPVGPPGAKTETLVASVNLIGDTLTQMPALKRYREAHPHERITWLLHDIPSMELFRGADELGVCDELIFHREDEDPGDSGAISRMEARIFHGRAFHKKTLLLCREAWHASLSKGEHIAQGYARCMGVRLEPDEVMGELPPLVSAHFPMEKWLPLSINSASSDPRDGDGFSGNKNFPIKGWVELLVPFRRAGYVPLLLQGPEDNVEIPGVQTVRFSIRKVAAFIKRCGIYAGVDNGITHIAAWTGAKCFVVYPQCLPKTWVGYERFGRYHLSQQHAYHGDTDRVLRDWRKHLP